MEGAELVAERGGADALDEVGEDALDVLVNAWVEEAELVAGVQEVDTAGLAGEFSHCLREEHALFCEALDGLEELRLVEAWLVQLEGGDQPEDCGGEFAD